MELDEQGVIEQRELVNLRRKGCLIHEGKVDMQERDDQLKLFFLLTWKVNEQLSGTKLGGDVIDLDESGKLSVQWPQYSLR